MKAEGYNFEDNTKSTYELPPPNDVSAIKSYRKTEGFGLRSLAKMRSAFKESNVQPQGYSEQLSACRSQGGEAVKVDIDAFAKATESLGQARLRILSEPSVRRSLESYSRCMKESGYTVETPEDTLKLVLLRFTQDKGKSEVYEYERRVADDEIGCLDTLGPYISELQKVQQSTFSRLGLK